MVRQNWTKKSHSETSVGGSGFVAINALAVPTYRCREADFSIQIPPW